MHPFFRQKIDEAKVDNAALCPIPVDQSSKSQSVKLGATINIDSEER